MHEDRLKALRSLQKLKTAELEVMQADMAACVAEEARISLEIEAAEKEIEVQRTISPANDLSPDTLLLQEAFRDWLPLVLENIKNLETDLAGAKEKTEVSRMALIAVKSGLEATTTAIDRLVEEDRVHRERKEQNEIDDISRTQFLRRRNKKSRQKQGK